MVQFLGFGDGRNGDLVVSSNITDAPVDSTLSIPAGTRTGVVSASLSISAGDIAFLWQTRGSGSGNWELAKVESYSGTTIIFESNIVNSYSIAGTDKAQIIIVKQYRSINVNSGFTLTAKAWNGTVGGAIVYLSASDFICPGTISGLGKGFRGGVAGQGGDGRAFCGEGSGQESTQNDGDPSGNGGGFNNVSSAGGGHFTTKQSTENGIPVNVFGTEVGISNLTTIFMGGAGGGASSGGSGNGAGANSGAILFVTASNIVVSGLINCSGDDAPAVSGGNRAGSGGAGSSIFLRGITANIGTNLLRVSAGLLGTGGSSSNNTDGSVGRIRVEACSITGTVDNAAYGSYSKSEGGHSFCVSGGGMF